MAHSKNLLPIESRPKAELLTIGTELVKGSVLNTNAAYLGRELTELGFEVHCQNACPDDPQAIKSALRLALVRSDVIFITGGLGPTPDDITRETLAEFFQVPLVFSKTQYQLIRRYYQKRKKRVPSVVKREAHFPANARPVLNEFGIALGFLIEEKGQVLLVAPGVPGELIRLFERRLRPYLQRRFPELRPASRLIVKTMGLSEPTIMQRLGPSFFRLGSFQFGIYPEAGEVGLRIYSNSPTIINRLQRYVRRTLGKHIYSYSDESIESVIGNKLKALRWTLAIAESCTGGEVSKRITRIPGASLYFKGAVVAYQNEAKAQLLGVSTSLIEKKGAVSPEVVMAMARGTRRQFDATLGIAVTGIAGPTGGSAQKPVGLVYIAIASKQKKKIWREHFWGDRSQIQTRASKKVLEYLWRWLP